MTNESPSPSPRPRGRRRAKLLRLAGRVAALGVAWFLLAPTGFT